MGSNPDRASRMAGRFYRRSGAAYWSSVCAPTPDTRPDQSVPPVLERAFPALEPDLPERDSSSPVTFLDRPFDGQLDDSVGHHYGSV